MATKPDKKKKLNVKLESFDLTISDVFGIILRTLKLLSISLPLLFFSLVSLVPGLVLAILPAYLIMFKFRSPQPWLAK